MELPGFGIGEQALGWSDYILQNFHESKYTPDDHHLEFDGSQGEGKKDGQNEDSGTGQVDRLHIEADSVIPRLHNMIINYLCHIPLNRKLDKRKHTRCLIPLV